MIKYFLIGSIGGLLSGILGIGGGVVFVPLLTYLTKTDFKTNTGVSSLAVVFVATGSSITYIFNDFSSGTNLVFEILIIIIGGIIGGYFGSKLTTKLNHKISSNAGHKEFFSNLKHAANSLYSKGALQDAPRKTVAKFCRLLGLSRLRG